MIQGYAIYLRTHRKTGKQYAGAVWWSESVRTPEWATTRRWSTEDRKGIHGVFGGFDSKIVLSEKRADAPIMSEGFYHIRIAVDEAWFMEHIPINLRLNKISPLLQLKPNWLNEEIRHLGRQKAGRRNAASGHMRRISILGRTHEHQVEAGLANVASGHIDRVNAALTFEDRSRNGKLGGHAAVVAKRSKGIPIFPIEAQKRNGVLVMHRRWHLARKIVNPNCELCITKG